MTVLTRTAHNIIRLAQRASWSRFMKATAVPEQVQRHRLALLLKTGSRTDFGLRVGMDEGWTWEEMSERLPVTDYSHWEELVNAQRKEPGRPVLNHGAKRWEPTSGSTARRKWIPYTSAFLAELDAASATWMYDMSVRFPDIVKGKHYWSLSWLPDDLRDPEGLASTDDLRLFPWWKRWLLGQVMAVPGEVALAPTMEQCLDDTLYHLAVCSDLSFMSVWSPTFALELFSTLERRRESLARRALARGRRGTAGLLREWDGALTPEFLRALWPGLSLISAWDTSTSSGFAARLRSLLPHAGFQGKGLWATEGVVTIPMGEAYPLALTSHFYEFRVLETDEVVPSWKLEPGMVVQPILTTGAGFFRYALLDRMRVTGFLNRCPTLDFLGRIGSSDMLGEKLDVALAQQVLEEVSSRIEVSCLCLFAQEKGPAGRPRYVLLAQGNAESREVAGREVEERLMGIHHYALARQMGQLDPAVALISPEALSLYMEQSGSCTAAQGNRKVEVLGCLPSAWAESLDIAPGEKSR